MLQAASWTSAGCRLALEQKAADRAELSTDVLLVDIVSWSEERRSPSGQRSRQRERERERGSGEPELTVFDLAPEVDLRVDLDLTRERRLLDRQPAFEERERDQERLCRIDCPLEGCADHKGKEEGGGESGSFPVAGRSEIRRGQGGPSNEPASLKGE